MMCKLVSILHQGMGYTLGRKFALELHNILYSITSCFIRGSLLCPYLRGLEFKSTAQVSLEPGLKKCFCWSAFFLSHRLKELEEKTRKQESRAEDIQFISCLQDKLSEREEIIKQLVVRFPSTYTQILWNLLEGSIQCFTHCF